jgi:hypothetical protein
MTTIAARNATLADLVPMLRDRQARKIDVVVPARTLRVDKGDLIVRGGGVELSEDGVTTVDGRYTPTSSCDGDIAARLDIPVKYLRRMRNDRPWIYDTIVNDALRGRTRVGPGPFGSVTVLADPDPRSFLLRCFRGDGESGIARALLSDTYGVMDDLDVLMAALDGVKQSGMDVEVTGASLTDTHMYVDVVAPQVTALAPVLFAGYRNPFGQEQLAQARAAVGAPTLGHTGTGDPIVFAGFRISNSEVGQGAFSIVPRLVAQICTNGMTINQDRQRNVHLGSRLEAGVVEWSETTQRKALELITAKTTDLVAGWLSPDYLTRKLAEIDEAAGKPVTDAPKTIELIAKRQGYSVAEQEGILGHFIAGGQMTAGGMLNAVTSYAQTVSSADRADEIESGALKVLALV